MAVTMSNRDTEEKADKESLCDYEMLCDLDSTELSDSYLVGSFLSSGLLPFHSMCVSFDSHLDCNYLLNIGHAFFLCDLY